MQPDITSAVDRIRYWHRQRVFAMEQRKRIDLSLGAFLRLMLGWSKDKPEAERKKIAARAAALIKDSDSDEWGAVIGASLMARKPFDKIEARCVKEMTLLAERLPAWPMFGESVRGFGPLSLAIIIAEAGNLSNYATPSKLWKRMGLAVMGGIRQGGLSKNASAETWIAHGYNRKRRSRMWNIGDCLIKSNRDGVYRQLYLTRKQYELARDPEMKPMKAHRRAQRYMEKRLLKNLWQAWRRAIPDVKTELSLPAANSSAQAERSAMGEMETSKCLPSASIPAQAGKRRATVTLKSSREMPAADHSASAEGPQPISRVRPIYPLAAAQNLKRKRTKETPAHI